MEIQTGPEPILLDSKTTRLMLGDISKTTLWRIVRSGALHPVKLGRKTMFRRTDIENYADGLGGGDTARGNRSQGASS